MIPQYFKPALYVGYIFLVVSIVLLLVGPTHVGSYPSGYHWGLMPILAFEFALNASEVINLFTNAEGLMLDTISQIDRLNYVDFVFMCCYGGFLSLVCWGVFRQTNQRLVLLGIILALIAVICDALENRELLAMTDFLRQGISDFDDSVTRMSCFTWVKWESLSFIFLLLIPFINGLSQQKTARNSSLAKLLLGLIIINNILGIATLTISRNYFAETYGLSTTLVFLLLFIMTVRSRRVISE